MRNEASEYLAARRIVRREPLYSANCFADLIGDITAGEMTTGHIENFRSAAVITGLAFRTIESRIADLITVVKHVTGQQLSAGNKLPIPRPKPNPVKNDTLCEIWPQSPRWLQQWMAIVYWTGLRLSDSMRFQLSLTNETHETISVSANKTQKQHVFPIPDWLASHLHPASLPYRRVSDFSRKLLRQSINSACRRASLRTVWTPKNLRQASITEWTRANATAGTIIHGCGLGVLAHYLDPLSVLESAAPRVRVPAAMRGDCQAADSEATLIANFRRMDPAAQSIITTTAERLSAG